MTGWTDARVQQLEDLWAEGLSCSQIGQQLGITRNAVIGKVSRLRYAGKGFMARDAAAARISKGSNAFTRAFHAEREAAMAKAKRKAASKPKPPPERAEAPQDARSEVPATHAAPEPEHAPAGSPVTLMQLSSITCRWPIGAIDGPNTLFCGAKAPLDEAKPYCEHHAAKACSGQQPRARSKPTRSRA